MYLHTNAHPKDKSFRVFCGDMHLDANVKKVYFMAYEITYILSIFFVVFLRIYICAITFKSSYFFVISNNIDFK